MKLDSRDLVSVSEISRCGVSQFINEAAEGRTFAVVRNNKVQAVIAGREVMERIEAISEMEENLRLWSAALTRQATDSGDRYSLAEVAEELGIDLAELEDED